MGLFAGGLNGGSAQGQCRVASRALPSPFSQPVPRRRCHYYAHFQGEESKGSLKGAWPGRASFEVPASTAFPLSTAVWEAAAGRDSAGLPPPQGRGAPPRLICLGEMTRTWNLSGNPGLSSLRMPDFTPGQSSPRLPEALGPDEQTRLLSSHRLTHLEASIWAVGRADSGRPRGTTSHDSLHPLQDLCHSQDAPKPSASSR